MEIITGKIESMAYGGRGVARVDGRVVFVAGALPGETVKAGITAAKKNFAEASLTEIISASPARQEPVCPYALTTENNRTYCPGCRYQHVSYKEEIAFKHGQLRELLIRLGKVQDPPLLQPAASPSETGYRNKLSFHCPADEKLRRLGYFTEDNTSIIDIPACPLGAAPLNTLLNQLRSDASFMTSLKPHMSVTLRCTEADGAVSWRSDTEPGAPLTETTPAGQLKVPRESFFQVNPAVSSLVTECVTSITKEMNPHNVIDLYCGVGVFALAAARAGIPTVSGIELDRKAVAAAVENAANLGLKNASFTAAPASQAIGSQLRQDRAPEKTLVILDPPRRGLDKEVVDTICRFKPGTLIYVSCAPDTLSRDAAMFTKAGYRLNRSQVFDMFPRTPYFETVSCLTLHGSTAG